MLVKSKFDLVLSFRIKSLPKSSSQEKCHNFEVIVENVNSEVGWFTLFVVMAAYLFVAYKNFCL